MSEGARGHMENVRAPVVATEGVHGRVRFSLKTLQPAWIVLLPLA